MKVFSHHQIGVDSGDVLLFSDFENDGQMWKGEGQREARKSVRFSGAYADAPTVSVQASMIDMSNEANTRADLQAENITQLGFDIVFRTWGDTRIARVRASWQAIGPVVAEDAWGDVPPDEP
jgi:hypothetical protein